MAIITSYSEAVPAYEDHLLHVDDPSGTPTVKKCTVEQLLGAGEWFQAYVTSGATAQSPGATYVKCTQLVTTGLASSNMSYAAQALTIARTGIYKVTVTLQITGSSNGAQIDFRCYLDAVAQTQLTGGVIVDTGATFQAVAFNGYIDVTSASIDLELHCQASAGSLTVSEGSLTVERIGNT